MEAGHGFDPRPQVRERGGRVVVRGARCPGCDHVVVGAAPRCPVCGAGLDEADFGPGGTVWSATVVRVPTPDRTPPYTLAYVDLDDGPRVLAHVAGRADAPSVGTRVRLTAPTPGGDVAVEVLS